MITAPRVHPPSIKNQTKRTGMLSAQPPSPRLLPAIASPKPPPASLSFFSSSRRLVVAVASATWNVAAPVTTLSTPVSSTWAEFASRVSGEWDGYGADFSSDGTPVQLPESVVPEAFREWGVTVLEWQTQCPTLASPDRHQLRYKLIKLLPTVGCEADAATPHSAVERDVAAASAFAYSATGCYVAAWKTDQSVLELEHSLIHPANKEVRLRVVQAVRLRGGAARLETVRVFAEHWDGPFRNGEQLGGCGGREAGFAAGPALELSDVLGEWESCVDGVTVARFSGSGEGVLGELTADEPRRLVRDGAGVVPLPKQAWACFRHAGGEGDDHHLLEVGWLVEPGKAVTSRCLLSPNDLRIQEIALGQETAASRRSS